MEYLLRPDTRRFHYLLGETKCTEDGPGNTDDRLLREWLDEGHPWDELFGGLIKVYFAEEDDRYVAQLV